MAAKPTNARKCMKLLVYLVHVSATHVAILREIRYKLWIQEWPKHVGGTQCV
jgi:predicted GIY-YIG superfamily endonuclease